MPIFKDKEVTILSKEEALWTRVKDAAEQRIKQMEEGLTVDRALLELAKSKIKLQEKK